MIIKLCFIYMINTLSCSEVVKIVTRLGDVKRKVVELGCVLLSLVPILLRDMMFDFLFFFK